MGSMSNNVGKAKSRKKPTGGDYTPSYPGRGWADNNLTDAQKAMCEADTASLEWDAHEMLLAAWARGYQFSLKRDRGKAKVFMATMVNAKPGTEDHDVWLSMRGSEPGKALNRLLWVWSVVYDQVLSPPGGDTGDDVW